MDVYLSIVNKSLVNFLIISNMDSLNAENKSDFLSFLSQLASFTGDLSQLTCPAFLLNGISLLEYSQHWCDHPNLLYDIANPIHVTRADKMLAVVKWFISTLYGGYRSRCENQSERKPFNPILGEVFKAKWEDKDNNGWEEASLVVEQVSHHPPISAFKVQIPSKRIPSKPFITVYGHNGQQTVFASAVKVTQVGRVRVVIQTDESEEIYTIYPLPELTISGLLTGCLFIEPFGKTRIVCTDGSEANIEIIAKGWFTGEYFQLKGDIKEDASSVPTYIIGGNWAGLSTYTKDKSTKNLFDVKSQHAHPKTIPDLSQQLDNESQKLWRPCIEALKKTDYANASLEKTKIEEAQRSIRKQRKENKETWNPVHFEFVVASNPDEKSGATSRDPQQSGGINQDQVGHWLPRG
ncbi:hypothetical protein BC833DRAFT_579111 [Globomyces pollinis-pini]|nr:hypothetical protein BC833DRAFT_579111 [Globomyces pollinis-pini]